MTRHVTVELITDEDTKVTVARASAQVWGARVGADIQAQATGSARCMEPDVYDEAVGNRLALGRALKSLGEQLEKEAYGVVHKRDQERQRRTEATERLLERKRAYNWKFLCEFAELINLKMENEEVAIENDTVPDTRFQTTGSILRDAVENKKKKPRKKAHQIREDLPA